MEGSVKATPENVAEAVGEMRKMVDGIIADDKQKMANIDIVLDKWEEKNQLLVIAHEQGKKAEIELNQRIAVLESELSKRHGSEDDPERKARVEEEYKAFEMYYQKGMQGLDHKAQLRTDDDANGGYLVPEMVDGTMRKKIDEIDPLRAICSVMTIPTKSIEVVVEESLPTAYYEAELEQNQYGEGAWSNVTLTAYRQSFTSRVTQDQIMNSGWPMEQQMANQAGRAMAIGEGSGFVTGTGVKEPEGFTVNASVVAAATDTVGNDAFAADDVLTLWGKPKDGYDLVWAMNRQIMVAIRKFKATTNSYLWSPGLDGPSMNTLCGEPYVLVPSMASTVADGAIILAIGDFRAGYLIVDRVGMSAIRDEVTQARNANVLITYHRWNTGRVIVPEAIKIMTVQ